MTTTAALCLPAALRQRVEGLGADIRELTDSMGSPVDLDWLGLLTERLGPEGFRRPSRVSLGGATRLLPCADSWVAVALGREDDLDLLPAWLGIEPGDDVWCSVAPAVADRFAADLVEGAALLGLPVAAFGERVIPGASPFSEGLRLHSNQNPSEKRRPRVVDLSGLWAGPLCGRLLALAGADVVKVESAARPDGARRGDPQFFGLLNDAKRLVTVDIASRAGHDELAVLIAEADVVIESSRPRGLEQLGFFASEYADAGAIWVSITGYGRASPRVAFGDDAAVAGGLVSEDSDGEPCFLGDAIADPLSGIVAAAVTLRALATGEAGMLDIAMADVAATFAAL